MTHTHEPTTPGVRPSGAWAGWITFAAVMLLLLGMLHVFQGFVAMFDDGFFVVARSEDLFLVDMTAWGVVMLCWGLLQVGAGIGLAQGKAWARWFAVVVVFVDVLLQIGFLSAYPIWSAILILLDVLVIFALTVRWEEARAAM